MLHILSRLDSESVKDSILFVRPEPMAGLIKSCFKRSVTARVSQSLYLGGHDEMLTCTVTVEKRMSD